MPFFISYPELLANSGGVPRQTAGDLEAIRDVDLSKLDASAMDVVGDDSDGSGEAEDDADENSDSDRCARDYLFFIHHFHVKHRLFLKYTGTRVVHPGPAYDRVRVASFDPGHSKPLTRVDTPIF